jgi:hypothetical protein
MQQTKQIVPMVEFTPKNQRYNNTVAIAPIKSGLFSSAKTKSVAKNIRGIRNIIAAYLR